MNFFRLNFSLCFLAIFFQTSHATDQISSENKTISSLNDLPAEILYKIISWTNPKELNFEAISHTPQLGLPLLHSFSQVNQKFKTTLEQYALPQLKSFLPQRVFMSKMMTCLQNQHGYIVCWNHRNYWPYEVYHYESEHPPADIPPHQIWIDLSKKIGLVKKIAIQELKDEVLFFAITQEDSLTLHREWLTKEKPSNTPKAFTYVPSKFFQPSSIKDIYFLNEGEVGCALRKSDSKVECWGKTTILENEILEDRKRMMNAYDQNIQQSDKRKKVMLYPMKPPRNGPYATEYDKNTYYGGLKEYLNMWPHYYMDTIHNEVEIYPNLRAGIVYGRTGLYGPSEDLNAMSAITALQHKNQVLVGIEKNTGYLKLMYLDEKRFYTKNKHGILTEHIGAGNLKPDSPGYIGLKNFYKNFGNNVQSIHGTFQNFCMLTHERKITCTFLDEKVDTTFDSEQLALKEPVQFFHPTADEACIKVSAGEHLGCALKQKDQFLLCWIMSPTGGLLSYQGKYDIKQHNFFEAECPHYIWNDVSSSSRLLDLYEQSAREVKERCSTLVQKLPILESIGPVVDFEISHDDIIMIVKQDGSVFMIDLHSEDLEHQLFYSNTQKKFSPSSEHRIGVHPNVLSLQHNIQSFALKKHLSAIKHAPEALPLELKPNILSVSSNQDPKILDYAMLWMLAAYIKKLVPDLSVMSLAAIYKFCEKPLDTIQSKDLYTLYSVIKEDIKHIFLPQPNDPSYSFRNISLQELMIAGYLELKQYLFAKENIKDQDEDVLKSQISNFLKKNGFPPNSFSSFIDQFAYALKNNKDSIDMWITRYDPENYVLRPYFFYDAFIKTETPDENLAYFLSIENLVCTVQQLIPSTDFFTHHLPSWELSTLSQDNLLDRLDYQKYLGLDHKLAFLIEELFKTKKNFSIQEFLKTSLEQAEIMNEKVSSLKISLRKTDKTEKDSGKNFKIKLLSDIQTVLQSMINHLTKEVKEKILQKTEVDNLTYPFSFSKTETDQERLKVLQIINEINEKRKNNQSNDALNYKSKLEKSYPNFKSADERYKENLKAIKKKDNRHWWQRWRWRKNRAKSAWIMFWSLLAGMAIKKAFFSVHKKILSK